MSDDIVRSSLSEVLFKLVFHVLGHMLMQDKSNGVIFGWNSSDKKHRRLKKERGSGGGAERKPKIDSYNLSGCHRLVHFGSH